MVAVARALSGDTKLLLLDEPFEGLSPTVVLELFRAFDALRKQVSILIVEHNLDLVQALADRVFVLERGAVVHQGPAKPLLDDLAYRKENIVVVSNASPQLSTIERRTIHVCSANGTVFSTQESNDGYHKW